MINILYEKNITCPQAYEKLLNITNHYRNANQNHETSPHTHEDGCYHKNKITGDGKDVEKLEPLMYC